MRSIELFAGAGGLAIGMARAGFHHAAVVEWDADACETFRLNQRHHCGSVEGWPVHETDVRLFDFKLVKQPVDVVSGGPPCQPFSMGGLHRGQLDDRNMFPEAVRAVRELRPRAFIFENVRGLTRAGFEHYFSYVLLQLQHPNIVRKAREGWLQHRARLEQHHTSNKKAPAYNVTFQVLNAADYGIPQRRERVFIVGFRSDQGLQWTFPTKTHSQEALLYSKWVDRSYWQEHPAAPGDASSVRLTTKLALLAAKDRPMLKRWRTTRDAMVGLPDPERGESPCFPNHVYTPGARTYPGHTGSLLDEPAKTLKAGQHGVPGGENMFMKDDGSVRYFTIREAARLQGFPDDFEFRGAWSEAMRQLGNAVPVDLGQVVAASVASALMQDNKS